MSTKTCGCAHDCDCHDRSPATAPESVVNSAGAKTLSVRVGTHWSFYETLRRRLSSTGYPQLARLKARQISDPSIALLDAWAIVGDVLTFYNERFIHEGYLRTATERRSLAELSALIGYRPGPGVAASVYLAFTLEKDPKQASEETLIPKGTAVKSVPGDGETSQTFETSDNLIGRPEWNALRPRLTVPQNITEATIAQIDKVVFRGTSTRLAANDTLLFVFEKMRVIRQLLRVEIDAAADISVVHLVPTAFSARQFVADQLTLIRAFSETLNQYANTKVVQELNRHLDSVASDLQPEDGLVELDKLIALERLAWNDNVVSLTDAVAKLSPVDADWDVNTFVAHTKGTTAPPVQAFLDQQVEIQKVIDILKDAWGTPGSLKIREDILIAKMATIVTDSVGAVGTAGTIKEVINPWTGTLRVTANALVSSLEALATGPLPSTPEAFRDAFITHWTTFSDLGLETRFNEAGQQFAPGAAEDLAIRELNAYEAIIAPSNPDFRALADAIRNSLDPAQEKWLNRLGDTGPADLKVRYHFKMNSPRTIPTAVPAQGLFDRLATLNAPATSTVTSTFKDANLALRDLIIAVKSAASTPVDLTQYAPPKKLDSLKDDVQQIAVAIQGLNPTASSATNVDIVRSAFINLFEAVKTGQAELTTLVANTSANAQKRRDGFISKAEDADGRFGDPVAWQGGPKAVDAKKLLVEFLQHIKLDSTLEEKVKISSTGTPKSLEQVLKELRDAPLRPDVGSPYELRHHDLVDTLESLLTEVSGFVLDAQSQPTLIDVPGVAGLGKAFQNLPPSSPAFGTLTRSLKDLLSDKQVGPGVIPDLPRQIAGALSPQMRTDLVAIWRQIRTRRPVPRVLPLKTIVPLFGYNVPRKPLVPKASANPAPVESKERRWNELPDEQWKRPNEVFLSQPVEGVSRGTYIVFRRAGSLDRECLIESVTSPIQRSAWEITSASCQILLAPQQTWHDDVIPGNGDAEITLIRTTLALVANQELQLAEIPVESPVSTHPLPTNGPATQEGGRLGKAELEIELDGLYPDLEPGRVVIIEGERSDLPRARGRELARIKYLRHVLVDRPNDRVHTRLVLERNLTFEFKRTDVRIYANVVKATHGETNRQVLGSGDASQAFQRLPLAKGPLTHLAAPTPSGVENTLEVRVNNIRWHEQDTLFDSPHNAHDYVLQDDDGQRSLVQFGDGVNGARVPTGRENVRAEYRVGLGLAGNVKAGAITQLGNRPLGLKEVINPLPATGGADPENVDQLRTNAPLAVTALDRLVSVRDYADFARNYAGIDKATAKRLLVGGQPTVHVTIAGAGDLPIGNDSDLFVNLQRAYRLLGDPLLSVDVGVREFRVLFLSAGVRLKPDFDWESIEPQIREALYRAFGFSNRELAQDVYLSEVLAVIQAVDGVEYVDVDIFAALSETTFKEALRTASAQDPTSPLTEAKPSTSAANALAQVFEGLLGPAKRVIPVEDIRINPDKAGKDAILPAQIAYFSREVSDSLFLTEITR